MATISPKQLFIKTYIGDILTVSVDAIVTGEGPDLNLESQVTKALLAKLPEFRKRRDELKKKNKHLPLWSVHDSKLSKPTPLQHKYILHAVLDKCENESQWLRDMVSLYNNIIKKADTLKISSLAIPLLGAGRANSSASLSVEAATKAVTWAQSKYLTNVVFVSQDPQISEMIEYGIKHEQTDGEPPDWIWRWTGLFDHFRDRDYMKEFSETLLGKHSGAGRVNRTRSQHHHQGYTRKCEDDDLQRALELSKMESTPNVEHCNEDKPSMDIPTCAEGSEALGKGYADGAAYGADAYDDGADDQEEENPAADDNNETLWKSRDPQHSDDTLICPICLNTIMDPKQLDKCKHIFCKDCIDRSFKEFKTVCPSCNMVYGILTGDQPDGSTMDVAFTKAPLPGYGDHGTITIGYRVPNGVQKTGHPHPGLPYKGTRRTAYLPDNSEGNEVLGLLRKAFDRKLTFTIGRSTTTGQENIATWNDIHHKTNIHGGPTRFGYPDPSYFTRVKDELASKGVTTKD